MPWDETDEYIRSGHREPDDFLRLRTINISEDEGIKAVGGPLKSAPDGGFVVQSYLFSKDKGWTMVRAKAWFREHEAQAGTVHQRSFMAALHSIETGDETHLATFYIMNNAVNRNRWGVTDDALELALPQLLNKPIGLGEGYKEGHFKEAMNVGRFVKVNKPDGYALGTVEITDLTVWEMLSTGELGPVSVVISSYKERCSACGKDITNQGFDHPCIKEGAGHILVESFKFDRVDFVDNPAYPQAGLLNLGAGITQIPIQLCAEVYNLQSCPKGGNDPPQGAGAGGSNPEEKEKKTLNEKITQLEQKVTELTTRHAELTNKNATLQTQYESLKAENTALKATQDQAAAVRQAEIVATVLDARKKAGLVPDAAAEKERLTRLNEDVLRFMKAEADKIAERGRGGPKAKPGAQELTDFEARVADVRMGLFGHAKSLNAEVK